VLITIGRLGRPHGIRGEVTVEVRTDEPERYFIEGNSLEVYGVKRRIERVHWHGQRLLLTFDGVHDRDAAESLRGAILTVERDVTETPTESDEFYDASLVGCEVRLESGTVLGVVSEVAHLPAQDLLVVCDAVGREHLIPFVQDIVPEVNIGERFVVINPPSGLLEP
jgi:16S rRNA processing protein RimM